MSNMIAIEKQILLTRGKKVLLQAVKRNIDRFSDDFIFQLTDNEKKFLRSQIVTSKGRGGWCTLPYAFTEQGVAMLSSVSGCIR